MARLVLTGRPVLTSIAARRTGHAERSPRGSLDQATDILAVARLPRGYDLIVTKRPRLISTIALVVAVVLFVAGVVMWRLFSTWPHCSGHVYCGAPPPPPHRLHPLRAELLWAGSAFFLLVAIGVGLKQWRRPTTGRPAEA